MNTQFEHPIFINESKVKSVLSWPAVNCAVEQALKSAPNKSKNSVNDSPLPFCCQPARTFTVAGNNGVLLSMPGYVGSYKLNGKSCNTLACKLVTSFQQNENRKPPLPNILANILLFDDETGRLKCIIEGTKITAWRTASASIVATKYLYCEAERRSSSQPILAVVGCGVQGRIHTIGFANCFDLSEIRLWNRTLSTAENLAFELKQIQNQFVNKNLKITICSSIGSCLSNADIIVTATYTSEPLIHLNMLKTNVHINAIGAGQNHHSEISQDIYDEAQVFIDNWESARTELKDLKTNIICEVGEIIISKKAPKEGITIFQSMGMASEDATVAQVVFDAVVKGNNNN